MTRTTTQTLEAAAMPAAARVFPSAGHVGSVGVAKPWAVSLPAINGDGAAFMSTNRAARQLRSAQT